MRTFAPTQKPTHHAKTASFVRPNCDFSWQSRSGQSREEDVNRTSALPGSSAKIQSNLTVNTPGDRYEQEADRLADHVMRMPEPELQRACGCGGECPKCQAREPIDERQSLGTSSLGAPTNADVSSAAPIVREALRSPGQPLDLSTKAYFEPRFGHDFSKVRVHADKKAAESAETINARAYSVGHDIVFGTGQYRPEESGGKRLLAHELAHVCQQSAQSRPSIQRQAVTESATTAAQSDAEVERFIAESLAANGNILEVAWMDLRDRRCLPQNCGDENMAAAEHYLFARYMVEDGFLPPDMMLPIVMAAVVGYSLWKFAPQMAGYHAPPIFCPENCLVTPTSAFQVKWGLKGAEEGNIMSFVSSPPGAR